MNAELQSLVAVVLIAGAVTYLTARWWKKRQRSQSGCGDSDACACPTPKLKQSSDT